MFKLAIKTDNAAFEPDDETETIMPGEMARILRKLADGFADGERTGVPIAVGEGGPVFDINGNRVGEWTLS